MASHKIKLTDAAVKRINPPTEPGVQDEYHDLTFPGFQMRIGTSGKKVFNLTYRYNGRQIRYKCGVYVTPGDLGKAKEKARWAIEQLDKGFNPSDLEKGERRRNLEAPTVKELGEDYLERHCKKHKRSWPEDERRFQNVIFPYFEGRKAKDVKRREMIAFLDDITQGRLATSRKPSPVEANRVLALLSAMFNWAIDKDIVEQNPCMRIRSNKETPKQRAFTDSEIKKFWKGLDGANMPPMLRLALQAMLATGQRSGEIRQMAPHEIEGEWWTIPETKTKNGLRHRVYLSPLAMEAIREARALFPNDSLVFANPLSEGVYDKDAMPKAVSSNLDAFKIEKFTPHNLRHTVYTKLIELGFHEEVADAVTNHKKQGIQAHYNLHKYDNEKRLALTAWANRLDEILHGQKAENVVSLGRG